MCILKDKHILISTRAPSSIFKIYIKITMSREKNIYKSERSVLIPMYQVRRTDKTIKEIFRKANLRTSAFLLLCSHWIISIDLFSGLLFLSLLSSPFCHRIRIISFFGGQGGGRAKWG